MGVDSQYMWPTQKKSRVIPFHSHSWQDTWYRRPVPSNKMRYWWYKSRSLYTASGEPPTPHWLRMQHCLTWCFMVIWHDLMKRVGDVHPLQFPFFIFFLDWTTLKLHVTISGIGPHNQVSDFSAYLARDKLTDWVSLYVLQYILQKTFSPDAPSRFEPNLVWGIRAMEGCLVVLPMWTRPSWRGGRQLSPNPACSLKILSETTEPNAL